MKHLKKILMILTFAAAPLLAWAAVEAQSSDCACCEVCPCGETCACPR